MRSLKEFYSREYVIISYTSYTILIVLKRNKRLGVSKFFHVNSGWGTAVLGTVGIGAELCKNFRVQLQQQCTRVLKVLLNTAKISGGRAVISRMHTQKFLGVFTDIIRVLVYIPAPHPRPPGYPGIFTLFIRFFFGTSPDMIAIPPWFVVYSFPRYRSTGWVS